MMKLIINQTVAFEIIFLLLLTYTSLQASIENLETVDEAKIQLEEDEELMMNLNDEGTKLNDRSIYLFQNDNPSSNYDVQILKEKTGNDDTKDALIYSGEGSGCFHDDEDDCLKNLHDNGSGDDLITPVYISNKPTSQPSSRFRPNVPFRQPETTPTNCDDEEEGCDGSGSGEPISPSSSTPRVYVPPFLSTTRKPYWLWPSPPRTTPIINFNPNVTRYPRPFKQPTESTSTSRYEYTYPPAPTAPTTTNVPMFNVTNPFNEFLPPRGPTPAIYNIPGPEDTKITSPSTTLQPPSLAPSPNDKTAMIIGVIAIGLIAVVIIAPIVLFLKVKYQNGGVYKQSDRKNFQFAPVSGAPGGLIGPGMHQTHLLNGGTSRTSPNEPNKPLLKMSNDKDLKEWYV